ncbi:MAG: class II aldolase/adducin family protein [Erysipelotrichaceae bacterium]|nr:class II aldolase/adducin family protein [Erysipelotrichaceae bacterium]
MNNKYLLGLDNGGSDIKCALFDLEGNEISVASKQLRIDTPEPGFTQRDCEKVFRANIEVIREAIRDIDPVDIMAVGITAYGNGVVLVDEVKGEVSVTPFTISSDEGMGIETVKYKNDSLCVILKNHGVMAYGKSLEQALSAAIYLEESCDVYLTALATGREITTLTKEQIAAEDAPRGYYGQ